jgi:glycosyltransferase involved in cell wall biosynthesis
MKRISVIIPIYNSSHHIKRCLDSVLAQSIVDQIVIIAVDDGSTDDSGAILDAYASENPVVFKVIHQENRGIAGARNRGLREVETEFFSFIDNDDTIEPDFFERYLEAIEEVGEVHGIRDGSRNEEIANLPDFVLGGYRNNFLDEPSKNSEHLRRQGDALGLYTNTTFLWASLYRTSFVREAGVLVPDSYLEDYGFLINLFNAGAKVRWLDYVGYNWSRYSESSMSKHSWWNSFDECSQEAHIRFFDSCVSFARSIPSTERLTKKQQNLFEYALLCLFISETVNKIRSAPRIQVREYLKRFDKWQKSAGVKLYRNPLIYNVFGPPGASFARKVLPLIWVVCYKLHLIQGFLDCHGLLCRTRNDGGGYGGGGTLKGGGVTTEGVCDTVDI